MASFGKPRSASPSCSRYFAVAAKSYDILPGTAPQTVYGSGEDNTNINIINQKLKNNEFLFFINICYLKVVCRVTCRHHGVSIPLGRAAPERGPVWIFGHA